MLTEQMNSLRLSLSSSASVITPDDGAECWCASTVWWSDYRVKKPAAVVMPATEQDVVKAVTYASQNNIPFVVKGGGHSMGFSSIESPGIIIDLSLMRTVTVDSETNVVIAQGGATIGDGLVAAAAAGLAIATGTCDSVGLVGSTLGGGIGRWFGYWGYAADNVVSMRVVVVGDSSEARLVEASSTTNRELFWALRGNGHLFGVVTEARFQGHPWKHLIWHSTLVFEPSKAVTIAEELDRTLLTKEMHGRLAFVASPPDRKPLILLQLWYIGAPDEATHRYAGLLNLPCVAGHPLAFIGKLVPHHELNHSNDSICAPGGRKNISAFILEKLRAKSLAQAFEVFTDLVSHHPDVDMANFLLEFYSLDAVSKMDKDRSETSISPELRQLSRYWVMPLTWYHDSALDSKGIEYNRRIRKAFLTDDEGRDIPLVEYINMPSEDVEAESVFGRGGRVDKLKKIKAQWDPLGLFRGIISLPYV